MNKTKYIIGIDPDLKKSGVCLIRKNDTGGGFLLVEYKALKLYQLYDYLRTITTEVPENYVIVIEKGEKNRFAFTAKDAKSRAIGAKINQSVGKNFAVTELLIEFCEDHKYNFETYTPKTEKFNERLVYTLTGKIIKNADIRDALRCAVSKI
jgi:hypothetical protein